MKKRIAIFLAALMVVQALTGCGAGGDNKTNGVDNTQKTEGETNLSWDEIKATIPEELKGTTVKFYNWNGVNEVPGAQAVIDQFTKETGIKVEYIQEEYTKYATTLATKIAADESPDIVRLRDLDPAVIKLLKPLSEVDYDFTDQAWDHNAMYHYQFNGTWYAAALDNTPYFQPLIMYYNKTLISKYGLEDPYQLWKDGKWTWDKCMELTSQFLSKAGDQYYGMSMVTGSDYAYSLGTSFISYEPEKNQYVSHMEDANLVKGWQYVAQNVKKGLVMEDIYKSNDFEAGTLLFFNDASISARTTHFNFRPMKQEGTLGTVPMPSVEGQETYYQMLLENEAYGIASGSKNPEAAAYFLRFFLDADNYDMNEFYCDAQAKEVVEWCKGQTYVTSLDQKISKAQYGESMYGISIKLLDTDAAQINTVLHSYASVLSSMMNQGNKTISSLKSEK